ncbi:hypothetical protein AX14_008854 [Amanita brunnescens Koide BX004]|nr:hypothetical protein AX14_000473 [Amanita brunnescens Koide BX004]KAF8724401.1 hypothetical protein AX14_008854 [Amanita brunnescens Koide BX004]
MYSKLAILATAAFALFAAAAPTPNAPKSTCSTGPVQCCNGETFKKDSPGFSTIAGLLGVDTGDVASNIFTDCSPFDGGCGGQTACCNKVNSSENLSSSNFT